MKPIISAQLFTVREYTKSEQDICETLKKIKALGYGNVQVSAFGPHRPEFLRKALDETGLAVCATHTPYERIVGETDAVIREHKMLHIPYVGLGYRLFTAANEVEGFLRELLPAAKKLREHGLRFLYHNHHHEFARLENGKTAMQMLLEATDPEDFGLLVDTHWLQAAGVSPTAFLRAHGDRIPVIHLKDYALDSEYQRVFASVGEGNMDILAILEAAEEIGVRYAAVEQDDCYGEDPFACLARSRAYLASLGY